MDVILYFLRERGRKRKRERKKQNVVVSVPAASATRPRIHPSLSLVWWCGVTQAYQKAKLGDFFHLSFFSSSSSSPLLNLPSFSPSSSSSSERALPEAIERAAFFFFFLFLVLASRERCSHQLCRRAGRTGQGIGSEEASEVSSKQVPN